MFCNKTAFNKIGMLLGICLCTGSLCACGDDTDVIKVADLQQEIEVLPQENVIEEKVEDDKGEKIQGSYADKEQPSQEISEEIYQPNEVSITISAVGDVTLGNYPEQSYGYSLHETYDQTQDPAYFFENVYDIFSSDDMTLVNLEGVLTNAEEKREGQTYCLKGRPEYVNILTQGSVEAVGMANNHRLDYMQQGSDDTVAVLEEAGIVYAYGKNIGIYEVKGIRIGYVSVNELEGGAVVEPQIEDGIARLKEEQADLILVCCHWGIEREYYPEDYQQILGRKCIDWGADLVIGHHPHVLQGIEEYQGKFIIYSLGNFCFGANRNPEDKDTMIFQQTFTFKDGIKQEDKNIQVIPCSISSVSSRNDFKPTPALGEEAKRIIDKLNEYSRDFGVQFNEFGQQINEY